MVNTIVKKEQMLKAKDFHPLNKWHRLNSNLWIWDQGLIRLLDDETNHGTYFVTDKGNKKLWDLVTYCSDIDADLIIKYYEFPELLKPFISWVWNYVAPAEDWKAPNDKGHQMDYFPYAILWKTWMETVNKDQEVKA